MTPIHARSFLAVAAVAVAAAVGAGADVVILKDGFVVQGNPRQEVTKFYDKTSGTSITVAKSTGYDMINEGPKTTVFSAHNRQKDAAVGPDTKLRPDVKGYTQKFNGIKSSHSLPVGETTRTSEFNARWFRQIFVKTADSTAETVIDQQILYMDPYFFVVVSATHKWQIAYRTAEWDPKLIRKLLMMHPDLAEPDGKCAPLRRLALAKFLLDAGWLQFAKDELQRLKRDHPAELPNEVKGEHEKLLKEVDQVTAERYAREAELSLAAGRYQYTRDLLTNFPEKGAAAKEVARVAKVTADLKTGQDRYDTGRRLLRAAIDDVRGMRAVNARVGAAGGLALATWIPPKEATGQQLDLAAAGEQVYAELHQDSASRIETFVTMATEAERERAAGREPLKKPHELLAAAISGWAKGKNGATADPDAAWKLWAAREAVLAYQRGESLNARTAVLGRYRKSITDDIGELAQVISLLPPAAPEDLDDRAGKQVPLGGVKDSGIFRRTTLPVPGHATGVEYLVKLPPEYHHGRAYPVLMVLPSPGVKPEEFLTPLVAEADRYGYVLLVPEWTGQFAGKGYSWTGAEHVFATAALRDAVRHFTVDNDKVFVLGFGDGANMAMDVGASHPDLFAGVIAMGPTPKWGGHFLYYWQNAQKLPFYVITGEGAAGLTDLKRIYDEWMPKGYPSMMSLYKGRGIEWYSAETPVFFDWMSRKTRATPTSTLANASAGGPQRRPWVTQREGDNHFYWLQVDGIAPGNLQRPNGNNVPAEISGDVRGNNTIDVKCRGVTKLTVWLTADLIDWTKPVTVLVKGGNPPGYKPAVLQPNLEVLLEDYFERGDRRVLFLNKLEFTAVP